MSKEPGRKWDGRSRVSTEFYKKRYDEIFKKKTEELNKKQEEENKDESTDI
jgi:hypothetical protein